MEPDDFPKFPSASLPSIAPTTAAKPFSSTFETPTFEPPKEFSDFGPSDDHHHDSKGCVHRSSMVCLI